MSAGLRLSLIICTHNRADLLAGALDSLAGQQVPADVEAIVVDNHSSDTTSEVAAAFARRYSWLRYSVEPRLGLAVARNTGLHDARSRYVAYIDDDCRLPPGWMDAALRVLDQIGPDVFGGPYFAAYNAPRPRWYQDAYGSYTLGDTARRLGDNEYLSGGNIVFRRTLLLSAGGFDETLGMLGSQLRYGEETAILHKLWRRNASLLVYYSPAMAVQHLVRPEKMRLRWALKTAFADGRDSYRVFAGEAGPVSDWWTWATSAAQIAWRLGADLGRGVFLRDRTRYPYLENYVYEVLGRDVRNVGGLSAACRRLIAG